tara:strand:- start:1743 stop:2030 length:288 start_codon:yes stop_codon:yes gene_type:complete
MRSLQHNYYASSFLELKVLVEEKIFLALRFRNQLKSLRRNFVTKQKEAVNPKNVIIKTDKNYHVLIESRDKIRRNLSSNVDFVVLFDYLQIAVFR